MISLKYLLISFTFLLIQPICTAQTRINVIDSIPYATYPHVLDVKPDLPSPFMLDNGSEYLVAVTKENKYAIIEVTLSNDSGLCPQLVVDSTDFPQLANTGLHEPEHLDQVKSITGRPVEVITELGRPNGLSQAGFMAADEDIVSVLKADNRIVNQLGYTHPQLAKPLFHVLNMMAADLALDRWNMAKHKWENIHHFYYHDQIVYVEAEDTKGGQQSIFNDGIEGAFYIRLWHEFDGEELKYLKENYNHLSDNELAELKRLLGIINTGEMQPQYIMRYGFYEGHTYWRTDPLAIAFIFGFVELADLETLFNGDLYGLLTTHHTK